MTKSRKKIWLHLDKALSDSLGKQLLILLALLGLTLLLSFALLSLSGADWKAFCEEKKLRWWLFPLYLLIDPNSLNNLYIDYRPGGWLLFASTFIYILGTIVFTGMIIGVINNAIGNRVEQYRRGNTHYLKSGHYIIMGYDDMVPSLINDIFYRDEETYVLLLTGYDVTQVKEWLKKSVAKSQMSHIIVNFGQRTAKEYYDEIHLDEAKEIFIVGHRTNNPAHDAVNIECVDSICSYLNDHKSDCMPKRITCVFEDLDTFSSFKTTEIFKHVSDLDIEFVPYNFYTGWAKQVLLARQYREKSCPNEPFEYPLVCGDGIKPEDPKFVHLVFGGITNLSAAFAIEAAHMLHFPNFDEKTKQHKTRITFIDTMVDKEMAEFITRNRHFFQIQSYLYKDLSPESSEKGEQKTITDRLSKDVDCTDFLDVEFEFIKGDIFSKEVQQEIAELATKKDRYLSIFLAMAEQKKNFMLGMNMPDEVYDNEIPIFIRQDRADNFVSNLRETDLDFAKAKGLQHHQMIDGELESRSYKGRYASLYPFGMDDMAYCRDELSFRRAKLINYLYMTADYTNHRFTDTLVLSGMTDQEIWDEANMQWKELTVAEKWSNLYCAYNIPYKLASLRAMRGLDIKDTSHDCFSLSEEEVAQMARVEHNRWNVEKLLMGYRKPRPEEDKYKYPQHAKKIKGNKKLFIHHDIRPFDELDDIREMDFQIAKYIPWILRMTVDP